MPFCTNCGKAQSKLNGGTLCKLCFNSINKGSVRAKENLPEQTYNTYLNNNDIMEQTTNCTTSSQSPTPQELFEENFLNKSLTELNARDLVNMIHTISSKTVIPEIHNIKKDYHTIKAELNSTKKDLVKAQQDIVSLQTQTESLKEELVSVKDTSNNNLKYLVNHDRNVRSQNVIIFGIPEKTNIDSGEITANSDREKVSFVFQYIQVSENSIRSIFRLGKEGEKPRPIKVILTSRENAKDVLAKSTALSKYKEHTIYIKPDKSKSEQQEFTRLGKRKKELLDQNPTNEGQEPRVKLEKGVLKLDGIEVDRYMSVQSIF